MCEPRREILERRRFLPNLADKRLPRSFRAAGCEELIKRILLALLVCAKSTESYWAEFGSNRLRTIEVARKLILTAKILVAAFALILITLLGVRMYDSQQGPPLERWHTFIPTEWDAATLDASD